MSNQCMFCMLENKHSDKCIMSNENKKNQALNKVLEEAVKVLYFSDSSDYKRTLFEIVRILSPQTEKEFLNNERKAFVRVVLKGEDDDNEENN